jgi:hypothetical protein
MRNINLKSWLIAGLCLVPAAFAGVCPTAVPTSAPCLKAPEGGSALAYVLGAGITCIGAMLIRFRAIRK